MSGRPIAARVLVFRNEPTRSGEHGGVSEDVIDDVSGEQRDGKSPRIRGVEPASPERLHEQDLVEKIRGGDVESFEYFVVTYQKKIFRLVYTLLRDPSDADAITQDVFVKAFRAVAEFKGESALPAASARWSPSPS